MLGFSKKFESLSLSPKHTHTTKEYTKHANLFDIEYQLKIRSIIGSKKGDVMNSKEIREFLQRISDHLGNEENEKMSVYIIVGSVSQFKLVRKSNSPETLKPIILIHNNNPTEIVEVFSINSDTLETYEAIIEPKKDDLVDVFTMYEENIDSVCHYRLGDEKVISIRMSLINGIIDQLIKLNKSDKQTFNNKLEEIQQIINNIEKK